MILNTVGIACNLPAGKLWLETSAVNEIIMGVPKEKHKSKDTICDYICECRGRGNIRVQEQKILQGHWNERNNRVFSIEAAAPSGSSAWDSASLISLETMLQIPSRLHTLLQVLKISTTKKKQQIVIPGWANPSSFNLSFVQFSRHMMLSSSDSKGAQNQHYGGHSTICPSQVCYWHHHCWNRPINPSHVTDLVAF